MKLGDSGTRPVIFEPLGGYSLSLIKMTVCNAAASANRNSLSKSKVICIIN